MEGVLLLVAAVLLPPLVGGEHMIYSYYYVYCFGLG